MTTAITDEQVRETDPCVRAGMMRLDVHPCHSFPGDALPEPSTP